MLIGFAILAFIITALGGLFALRFKDKLHLVVGFSAGAVIGVALFDLLPEAFALAEGRLALGAPFYIALGFLAYVVLDRFIGFHAHSHEDMHEGHDHPHQKPQSSWHKVGSLVLHSFFDGIAIGFAFQVSNSFGAIVTIAVLAHDFSDGINTVSLALRDNASRKRARLWLLADCAAPVLGIAFTQLFTISDTALAIVLSVFAGFFLYIGASDLIPESFHNHPTRLTTAMTILGVATIYLLIHFAHA